MAEDNLDRAILNLLDASLNDRLDCQMTNGEEECLYPVDFMLVSRCCHIGVPICSDHLKWWLKRATEIEESGWRCATLPGCDRWYPKDEILRSWFELRPVG